LLGVCSMFPRSCKQGIIVVVFHNLFSSSVFHYNVWSVMSAHYLTSLKRNDW